MKGQVVAIKKCKECGGLVSTKAKTCPQCGAPVKRGTSAGVGCLAIIVVVIVIAAAMNSDKTTTNEPSPQSDAAKPSESSITPPPSVIMVHTGDDARVVVLGQNQVFVCVSTDAFSR